MTQASSDLLELSIQELGDGFRQKRWSPLEVARASLARIEATEPHLHAWVGMDTDRALASAAQAEREIASGQDRGPLHGVPIGIKDIYDVAGLPTHCGSQARADAPAATASAPSVAWLQAGGAVVLGKTVTQEFAAGTISPPARNPWDPERIPGGSSGGSAAAVAIGACFGAMGSDTGGSIRIPAAACGVTGFKPAFGELDVAGVFPLSWSLDTVGPIARTVDDTWHMWQVLQTGAGLRQRTMEDPKSPPRIGIARQFFFEWLQPGVRDSVDDAITRLTENGMTMVEAPWPDAAAARACAFLINRVETAAVHERVAVEEPERFSRYGAELRVRIAAGRTVPATIYTRAMRVRRIVKDSIAQLFAEHRLDILLAPTLPTTAIPADRLVIEGTGLDESVGAGWTRLTMPFNATGQPVLALPCGLDPLGLPVGIQLAGRPGDETRLFQLARAVERVLDFHRARPPLLRSLAPTEFNEEP
jgi:aspartyl-tRNA(Asn)/glutamyl-tRNA(Gln) amidotransferase subunit A